MNKNLIETLVGLLVIGVATYFLYFSYSSTNMAIDSNGYNINAKFEKVDGINIGNDVRVSGIKIGKITEMKLDPASFQAILTFRIKSNIKIPTDSTAQVTSSGLLGEKYIGIIPGSETEYLANNGTIEFTQSSINLENLIGKMIFSSSSNKEEKDKAKQ